MTRKFDISDVLCVTTGKMVSTRGMEGIYGILNYMTGDSLFTHQLPRACRECGPVLRAQHPDLPNEANTPALSAETWQEWLQEQRDRFGDELEVVPLSEWEHRDPVAEMVEMKSADSVIVPCAQEAEA